MYPKGDPMNPSENPERKAAGFFRGVAAVFRGKAAAVMAAKKTAVTQVVRAVGEARPLAFANEAGVAGKTLIPRWVYLASWGISGVAIVADVATKTMDAKEGCVNLQGYDVDRRAATAAYWSLFHVPASLVVPAVIIHKVVHMTENAVKDAKRLPGRAKAVLPVVAALLAIIPVVPIVDHSFEAVMEPTLGKYLGVEFHHHGHFKGSEAKDGESKPST